MAIEKVSTGVDGLDQILKDGYLKHLPTLIKGGPGTGKTIFTLFFAYAQIKEGNKVIYVTCDELPEQIISHMDSFGLKGSKLQAEGKLILLDLTPQFNEEIAGEFDVRALLLRIEQAKLKSKSDIVIIDSLQSMLLGMSDYDPQVELLILFDWARKQKITLLTTISETKTKLNTDIYEDYVVDCVIKLKQKLENNLMTRYLHVSKLRGSAHGTNEYPYAIINKGISLIPITETQLDKNISKNYLSTGITMLDRMLDNKGYQEGCPVMISGRSGTAKTLFAASFMQSALQQGKKVLFISFEESARNLIEHCESININLMPFIKQKKLEIYARRSVEMGLENHIISIIELDERYKFDVLILDPITALLDVGKELDVKNIFIRFVSYMRARNKTLFFTELLPDYAEEHSKMGLSSLTDTWIRLTRIQTNGEFNRLIHIAKSRGIKTSNQVKEFLITEEGIQIEEPYLGEKQMVFGAQKASYLFEDKQREIQHLQELEQLEAEIKALEDIQNAQNKVQQASYIVKKNELTRRMNQLLNKEKQLEKRRDANKLLRE